jgi:hypothetical protein
MPPQRALSLSAELDRYASLYTLIDSPARSQSLPT